jgi:hypothetical protein
MRSILLQQGIPAESLADAIDFLNSAPDATIEAFNAAFGMTPDDADALAVSRFAVDAIFKGAASVDKVVGYVAKRMLGIAPKPEAKPSPVVMVGAPVVDNEDVTVVPVVVMPEVREETVPTIKVKGKRGRKRLGDSDMCKAVAVIEATPGVERATLLELICAQPSKGGGLIKESSAAVYLWRYNKGERQ